MGNNTEVVFDNIEQRIFKEIEEAHYAIFVSVAWFTNKKLFNALLEKAKSNCYVSIIIQLDDINSQCGIDYSQIQVGRSECFMISKEAELLHEKFCIIDFRKVITGSYNWTYKASHNSENILILNDPSLATQYITRFEQQKARYADFKIQAGGNLEIPIEKTIDVENSDSVEDHSVEMSTQVNSDPEPEPEPTPEPPEPRCPSCQERLYSVGDKIFCTQCGYQLQGVKITRRVTCGDCSREQDGFFVDASTKYCTFCGSNNLKFKK